MAANVNDCIEQLASILREMPEYQNKVFHVYSESELEDRNKKLALPSVGIVYLGTTAVPDSSRPTNQVGSSAQVVLSLIFQFKHVPIVENDGKKDVIMAMDAVRSKILGKRSPTGHVWRFMVESPAESKAGVLTYTQRWSCPVQLV